MIHASMERTLIIGCRDSTEDAVRGHRSGVHHGTKHVAIEKKREDSGRYYPMKPTALQLCLHAANTVAVFNDHITLLSLLLRLFSARAALHIVCDSQLHNCPC